MVMPDGKVRFHHTHKEAILDGNNTSCQNIAEQLQVEQALQESKEKYQKLLASTDEGFCIIEMIFDAGGKPIDYLFLETNPSFERQTGLQNAVGKCILKLVPDNENYWLEIYGKVATSGESVRFENETKGLKRWFHVFAFKVGEIHDQKVGILFRDITAQKQTVEALHKSEERFRGILTASFDAVYWMNPDWREMRQLNGKGFLSDTETPSSSWLQEYILPEDQPHVTAKINEAIRTKSNFELEHRVRRADGGIGWVLSRAVPLLDPHGEIVEWFGAATDITERKRADAMLRESEERQRFLLKLSDALRPIADPVAIQETASRLAAEHLDIGRVAYCDIRYEPDIVVTVERDWPRRGMPSIAAGRYRMDDFGPFLAEELAAGRPAIVADAATDPRISQAERGNWSEFEIVASCALPVIKEGRLVAYIVAQDNRRHDWTNREITLLHELSERTWAVAERAKTVDALRESEQQLARELEAAELMQDLSTKLIQADNVEALYDQLLATMLKILPCDFATIQQYYPERGTEGELYLLRDYGLNEIDTESWEWISPQAKSSCALALKTHQRVVFPDVLQCDYMADGDILDQYRQAGIRAVQTTPLLSRSGALLGMFSTHWRQPHELTEREIRSLDILARQAADLIERRQVEEALRESEERYRYVASEMQAANYRKDEFLGILSHEIRNPLAAIDMGLYLLERAKENEEQSQTATDIMRRQANQLSRLINDLLDVTRINQNKIILRRERVELAKLVNQVIQDYEEYFKEKEIELKFQTETEPLYLDADKTRLIQIVGNLLHNAVKFTHQSGVVKVTLTRHNKDAVIQIEDSGEGMAPETLATLFTPFIQANKSLNRGDSSGLGIGLVLVKGLVELLDGEITAHSGGLGKGSRFTVRLPLAGQPVSQVTSKVTKSVTHRRLVEDIRDVAHSLTGLLESEGHEVAVAYDGAESIAKAKVFCPEILLCDIGLPIMNGYQVAQAFRADPELKDVFLVSVTGYARPKDIERAKEAGFNMHIAKPVDLTKLRKALSRMN